MGGIKIIKKTKSHPKAKRINNFDGTEKLFFLNENNKKKIREILVDEMSYL